MVFARPRSRVQSGAATVRGTIEPFSYVLLSGVSEEQARGYQFQGDAIIRMVTLLLELPIYTRS
jgi:hypothetical protein